MMEPAVTPTDRDAQLCRIGCVSYLNAKPLIDGLDHPDGFDRVRYDVPSHLLADLESGDVDIALCPVIDYARSRSPLVIVPAGGIGCEGPTLTVRLYSRVPIAAITAVHADTDSHTSVALLRVVLQHTFGITPRLIDYDAREQVAGGRLVSSPEAMLLIGDKVVTDSPQAVTYPHQLDLGEAWHAMTGLPFVFAVWMARADTPLGDLPNRLTRRRKSNAKRIERIADDHAAAHGWPEDLARQYLGEILRYDVGRRELQAIERFLELAQRLDGATPPGPLRVMEVDADPRPAGGPSSPGS